MLVNIIKIINFLNASIMRFEGYTQESPIRGIHIIDIQVTYKF